MALSNQQRKELTTELEKVRYLETIENQKVIVDRKNVYRNFNRCLNLQRKELEFEQKEREVKEIALRKQTKVSQDEKLANELLKLKNEEIRQEKTRQALRENSVELRDLERKLKAAYGVKALTAQVANKEAEKMQMKVKEKHINEELQKSWYKEEELLKQEMLEDMCKKAQYKQELQDQIIYKEKKKRFMYEEFLREKRMVDEVVSRMNDEAERLIQEKMIKMEKTREEMEGFKTAQQVWRNKQKRELEEENNKIQLYMQKIALAERKKYEEKQTSDALKEAMMERISRKMYEEEKKRTEREDVLQEMMEEEQKAVIEKKFRDEVAKQMRQADELKESFARQRAEKAQRAKADAEADARYKDQLLAKIAEDNRVEQLTTEKKRLKMLLLRKDVEAMMIQNRQRKAEEMQENIRLYEDEQNEMKERQRIIEQERLRMLKEHAHNLIGYMPKGVLRADDLQHLGSDVLENYKALLSNKSCY